MGPYPVEWGPLCKGEMWRQTQRAGDGTVEAETEECRTSQELQCHQERRGLFVAGLPWAWPLPTPVFRPAAWGVNRSSLI